MSSGRLSFDASPAPAWFTQAIGNVPDRSEVVVDGARIELLTWGEVGKPGLLFLHGNAAHADWWSFIAPQFAADHRVAAISWSGMGGSDWREAYSIEAYGAEIAAAIDAAGLDAGGAPPAIVAHSFGGFPALTFAASHPERLKALVLVDVFVRPAHVSQPAWTKTARPPAAYPTEEAALARFIYRPAQPAPNGFINAWIARRSLKPTDEGQAWTWRIDPQMPAKLHRGDMRPALQAADSRVTLIHGEQSALLTPEMVDHMRALAPHMRTVGIAGAGHHIMVDQPLALVAALKDVLA